LRELKDSINFKVKLNSLRLLKYIMFINEDYMVENNLRIFELLLKNIKVD